MSAIKTAPPYPHDISAEQVATLKAYAEAVLEANKTIDLTADDQPALFWSKHIENSLHGIPHIRQYGHNKERLSIVDIGSGSGIPAIPLAITLPQHTFTLIEPIKKRADFLQSISEKLSLHNVTIINNRAEVIGREPEHHERYDIVTARAVSTLASIAELALPLCAINGACILYKHLEHAELADASYAIHTLGSAPAIVIHGDLEHTFRDFVILHKKTETPKQFPRRNGLPQKRPLHE